MTSRNSSTLLPIHTVCGSLEFSSIAHIFLLNVADVLLINLEPQQLEMRAAAAAAALK